jgi:hypothetical protein
MIAKWQNDFITYFEETSETTATVSRYHGNSLYVLQYGIIIVLHKLSSDHR